MMTSKRESSTNYLFGGDVVRLAAERAIEQHTLASSPGEFSESGEPVLCAASCLAYAGLLIRDGHSAAEEFSRFICVSKNKAYVAETFESLGWPKKACFDKMEPNDARKPLERLPWFLSALGVDNV